MGTQLNWDTREEGSSEEVLRKVKRPMLRKEKHTRIPVMRNSGLLKQKVKRMKEKKILPIEFMKNI